MLLILIFNYSEKMISLRGKLERTKRTPPIIIEGAVQEPAAAAASATSSSVTALSSNEWIWRGHWAFGLKLPDDQKKWQKFEYIWGKEVKPADVLVISLNYTDNDDDEEDAADEEDEDVEQQEDQHNTKTGTALSVDSNTNTSTVQQKVPKAAAATTTSSTTAASNEDGTLLKDDASKSDAVAATATQVTLTTDTTSNALSREAPKDNKDDPTANSNKELQSTTTGAQPMDIDEKPAAINIIVPERTGDQPISADKSDEDAAARKLSVKFEEIVTKSPTETLKKRPKRPKITFATKLSDEDPPFTDASTKHPDKCPTGGQWKGHFENAMKAAKQTKKSQAAPLIQKIAETFHIYMNATPAADAQTWFPTEEAPKMKKGVGATMAGTSPTEGLLKEGQIHVRGTGTNQFGTFELLGSFEAATGMLECQRMYVTNLMAPSTEPKRRRSSSAQGLAEGAALAGTASKNGNDGGRYFTRKRPMSWKRKSSFGARDSDSDGDGTTPTRRRGGAAGASATKRVRVTEPKIVGESPSAALKKMAVVPGAGLSISIPPVAGKRPVPSPKGIPRSKKVNTGLASGGAPKLPVAVAPPVSNTYMKLPPVGDPKQAHWRAAHYLYYQKNDPSQDEGGGGSNSGSGGTPAAGNAYKYVVYEGEMFKSQREGRGVCLFSNQMIYEGGWKKNKESGRGTLMTSDRKRIIYQGEWERGKMHGRGVFYYSSGIVMNAKQQVVISDDAKGKKKGTSGSGTGADAIQSRYEGDFKENLRHGYGKYVLPDGSVYDGMWREGMMCGRGVFTWSDDSIYEGEWKAGRRHGGGLLRSSDGFSYDGMWVQNAMEGRGSAIYPNGQTYNGLFSNGKREGRGTIHFTNGAVYEGRFRDDKVDGQGTMKILKSTTVPRAKVVEPEVNIGDGDEKSPTENEQEAAKVEPKEAKEPEELKPDFLIPLSFQSDMGHIHMKAGFTLGGE